MLKGLYFLKG